jgi:hypothetical protein
VRLVTDSHWWAARRDRDLTSVKLTQDIAAARQLVRRNGITKLADYTLLSFLQAHFGTLISNLPVEVVEILAWAGQDEQANNLANLFLDDGRRVLAWRRLGEYYLDQNDPEKALSFLRRSCDRILLQTTNKHRPNHLGLTIIRG